LFNTGINDFIQRYGSRKAASEALGCSIKVMGQMLRGEMKVPLLRAFMIEALSKGHISIGCLLDNTDPTLAAAFKRSRDIHYRYPIVIKKLPR